MKKNKPELINSKNNTQKSPKNSQLPQKSILVIKKKQETNLDANQTFVNGNESNQKQNKTPKIQLIDQTNNITLISGQQSLLSPDSLTEYFKQLGTETEESDDEYDYDGLTSSQEIKNDSQNDSYLRLNRNNKRVTLYDLEVLEKHILNEEMKKNNIDKNINDGQKLKTSKSQNDNNLNKNQGQNNNFLKVQNNYNNSKTNKLNQENQFKTKLKSSEDTSENQNLISQNLQNFSKSIQQSFFKKTNINSDFDTAQRKNQIMELDSNQILDKDHESTREFINKGLNTQKQKTINTFSKHQKSQNNFLKQNPQDLNQNQDLDQINEQNEYNEIDDIKLANSEQYQERKNKSNQQTLQEQNDPQYQIDKDIHINQNKNQNIYSQSNINIIKSEDNINQYKYSQNLTKKNSKSENLAPIQQNITEQDMISQQIQDNQIQKESNIKQVQSIQPSNILKNKKEILANNIQKWRKATIKIVTIKQLSKVISDIRKYGTNMSQDIGLTENFLQKVKKQIISKYKKKKTDQSKYILKHNLAQQQDNECQKRQLKLHSKFMGFFYNYFLIFLYVWICITAPWLGFIWSHSEISQGYVILFKIIDVIIFLDIFLQLNLSYIDKEGKIILLRSKIVRKYIFRGLILDFLSCFPFEWFFNQSEILNTSQIRPEYYNQYFKILKLPILYRRARNGKYFLDQVKFSSSSIFRFYRFISNSLLGTHIAGCFYFFVAKLSDPNQNWIDHVDPERQLSEVDYYIFGLYWAIQTLTTVGFGDIMGFTDEERIVSMLWMTFGIGIYSYTLGAISTMIIETDSRMNNLEHGIILLDEFCRETGINMKLKFRIKKALQFNTSKTILSENEKEVFFEELDNRLKSDLSAQIFQNRMESNKRALPFIFSLTDDYNFLSKFIKYLKPLQQKKGEIVYRKGEYPTDLYFITKGRVNFTLFKKNQAFRTFVQGSYFGELEIFSKKKRLYTVVCDTDCEFLTIQSDSYTNILDDFQDIQKKIKNLAEKRAKIFLQNAQEKATKILEAKKKQKEQNKKKFLAELAQEYQKNSNVSFPIKDLKESPVKKNQVNQKEKENEFLMKKNLLPLNSEESQNKLTTLEINSPSNLLQQSI
ncbi:Cyclic nucleotide-binding protein [Pseudocohnilembus persalinus]|uniref:Cyclic nucleotide-binding protein n=1 Tax=Pseudocohnilembus persalinus TaxID=266149 RepID=A0A0V0R7I0_PSEPJ|nr:Cyclic nucleotide-binding protein [Pseudocohnilembus persalinus]|eukprot:KRX10444.1 Cyclic nucleotide-binding protein [Pseudocohnilembus persalinus]